MGTLGETREKVNLLVKNGSVNSEIFDLLYLGEGKFLPKESWQWDYKKTFVKGDGKLSLGKLIRSILSFHNTYGGYIVFGVDEVKKDKEFKFADSGDPCEDLHISQLRDSIKKYCPASNIDITFIQHTLDGQSVAAIHVPKRTYDNLPVSVELNGPEKNGRKIFNKGEVFLRQKDECMTVQNSQQWSFVFGQRRFEEMLSSKITANLIFSNSIEDNLPDITHIYDFFVGREEILTQLWNWLRIRRNKVKVLAGDGGKGKTSIAYHFCRDFASEPPFNFERVRWMSAKAKQFKPLENQFVEMPTPQFDSAISLLQALGEACCVDDTSWYPDASIDNVLDNLSEAIKLWPSLYVLDDIDSLTDDDQRRVVDYCRDLDAPGSKFLFTTRKKFSYSSDLCISVGGLEEEAFKKYLQKVSERLCLPHLTKSQFSRIYRTTDGSPLLSKSILRLCKQGDNLDVAIREWENRKGEDARNAALIKEIGSLSTQSKRVLYSISLLHSCSKTELRQLTELGPTQLSDCLEELEALFVVGEPEIIRGEPRYSISSTTRLIVRDIHKDLADDHRSLSLLAKRLRGEAGSVKGRSEKEVLVAKIISQAVAAMKADEFQSARDVLNVGLEAHPSHRDLLAIEARYFLRVAPPDFESARASAKAAIAGGNSRRETLETLYLAEMNLESVTGAIHVCEQSIAKRRSVSENVHWYQRLSDLLYLRSKERSGESLIADLAKASEYISVAVKNYKGPRLQACLEKSKNISDDIILSLRRQGVVSSVGVGELLKLVELGDSRTKVIKEAHNYLTKFKNELSGLSRDGKNKKTFNLYEQRVREFNTMLETIRASQPNTSRLDEFVEV